jgi:hypothetical protein
MHEPSGISNAFTIYVPSESNTVPYFPNKASISSVCSYVPSGVRVGTTFSMLSLL